MSGDPARLLLRALRRSALAAGCDVTLSHEAETPWASATFVGAQHRILVGGESLTAWLATLPETELPISGHFVASCAVEQGENSATLTLLVLAG